MENWQTGKTGKTGKTCHKRNKDEGSEKWNAFAFSPLLKLVFPASLFIFPTTQITTMLHGQTIIRLLAYVVTQGVYWQHREPNGSYPRSLSSSSDLFDFSNITSDNQE